MFRLLGFDVQVRTGFVMFLGLIVLLNQDAFGLWLAVGIAGFTLLHELGHAVAARSVGAHASISLDFLAGYTSFQPDPQRPISRGEHALISAAGPLTQIAISIAVLFAMGINPTSIDSIRTSEAGAAIWWAGPMIGALNLIPVLPLDGGHLVMTGLETFLKERAMRTMVIISLVLTGSAAIAMFLTDNGGFAIFVAFLLIHQFQMLQTTGNRHSNDHPVSRLRAAETAAWQTGRPPMLEPGQRLSPWYDAHRALASGDQVGAVAAIVNDLQSERQPKWVAPTAASAHQLRAIVDVLPADLPHGNSYSERMLVDVLLATNAHERAGRYGVEAFGRHRTSVLATAVSRSAAALGEQATAIQWLGAASDAATGEERAWSVLLAATMDQAPEYAGVRNDPAFQEVRRRLATAPTH